MLNFCFGSLLDNYKFLSTLFWVTTCCTLHYRTSVRRKAVAMKNNGR
jgi:hypothetical protein